jgi:hypothetical protein
MSASGLDLGAIGNGTVAALVDGRARIVWCCFPRFDADPMFCALLRPAGGGGMFEIEVEGASRFEQRYLPNSAVLRTEIANGGDGRVAITDFSGSVEIQVGYAGRATCGLTE